MTTHPNRSKAPKKKRGRSPSASEVQSAREASGLTQKEASKLVYVAENTWQQWELDIYDMHPAFWELFLLKTLSQRGDNTLLKGDGIPDES